MSAHKDLLEYLDNHGGYHLHKEEPNFKCLHFNFDYNFYIPKFQFEKDTMKVKREVLYLLHILDKKKCSNIRKVNFFLKKCPPFAPEYNVISLIDSESIDVQLLIIMAENFNTNNLL